MSSNPVADFRAHAEFHARESPTGIGAAVVKSSVEAGERVWECIVTDGREWHYVRVVGVDLPPFPNISSEQVEEGIERFAATLPAQDRLRHLLNANPLHIDADGAVSD
ncbi:MAG: hypothetical protein ACXVFQ_16855 [Solirubrobacteraceae bacterium]